ncbi:hypothetical protein GGI42DRAFT_195561 [Trichoderma sp. SZMC 28013]
MAARIQRSLRKSRDPRCHVRGEQTGGKFSDRQSLLVSQDVISKGVQLGGFFCCCSFFLRLVPSLAGHPLVAAGPPPWPPSLFLVSSKILFFCLAIHVPDKPELCGRS